MNDCNVNILLTSLYLYKRDLAFRYNNDISKLPKWNFKIKKVILENLEFKFIKLYNFGTFLYFPQSKTPFLFLLFFFWVK